MLRTHTNSHSSGASPLTPCTPCTSTLVAAACARLVSVVGNWIYKNKNYILHTREKNKNNDILPWISKQWSLCLASLTIWLSTDLNASLTFSVTVFSLQTRETSNLLPYVAHIHDLHCKIFHCFSKLCPQLQILIVAHMTNWVEVLKPYQPVWMQCLPPLLFICFTSSNWNAKDAHSCFLLIPIPANNVFPHKIHDRLELQRTNSRVWHSYLFSQT